MINFLSILFIIAKSKHLFTIYSLKVMVNKKLFLIEYDWKYYTKFMNYVTNEYMNLNMKESPVIMSKSLNDDRELNSKVLEVLFEQVGTPAVYLANKPMLNGYL